MNILVLNCGSSSLKFQIIATDQKRIDADSDVCLAKGLIERIGSLALFTFQAGSHPPSKEDAPVRDHRAALERVARWLSSPKSGISSIASIADIHAVGHRVVHGGEKFQSSVRINASVIAGIEECVDLAPLHNPANLRGIRASQELFGPKIPQAAVFDTAFHAAMPPTAYLYAIPYNFYRRYKIRRYGFHGTSHRYVAYRYRQMRSLPKEKVKIISLHLGNGCSACAIKGGRSINTSMGFTPLEGLVMGTRAGDIDASIIPYLAHKEGMSLDEIETMLNKQSGLLGISGLTGDMRELLEEEKECEDRRAHLAIDMFCSRVRRFVGAYYAELGGADAVVFTGGIGENSPEIRARICSGLECLGLKLDQSKNSALISGRGGAISRKGSKLEAYVIPTNEELLIARDTFRVITGRIEGGAINLRDAYKNP